MSALLNAALRALLPNGSPRVSPPELLPGLRQAERGGLVEMRLLHGDDGRLHPLAHLTANGREVVEAMWGRVSV